MIDYNLINELHKIAEDEEFTETSLLLKKKLKTIVEKLRFIVSNKSKQDARILQTIQENRIKELEILSRVLSEEEFKDYCDSRSTVDLYVNISLKKLQVYNS